MSTVDKKLMYQMLRLTKATVETVTSEHGQTSASQKEVSTPPVKELARTVFERGIKTLPLEQRILLNAEQDKHSFEMGRSHIVMLLGTWGVMGKDTVEEECNRSLVPDLLPRLIEEGTVRCYVDSSLGSEQEVVTLTEAGQELFNEREGRLNDKASVLFESLNEHEKIHLYLLLRKLMGTPAYEGDASDVQNRLVAAAASA